MILYRNLHPFRIYDSAVDLCITAEDETLTVTVFPTSTSLPALTPGFSDRVNILYNGVRKSLSGGSQPTATFSYDKTVQSLQISVNTVYTNEYIYYNETSYGRSYPISWDAWADRPVCTFAPISIHEDYGNRLRWTFDSGDGRPCAAVSLWYYQKKAGQALFSETRLLSDKYLPTEYVHTLPPGIAGEQCYYRLCFCSYDEASDPVDHYITYNEATTPIYVIGQTQKIPAAPASISYPRVVAGDSVTVSWPAAEDSFNTIAAYALERQVNGGGWTAVYQGASLSFTDRLDSASETVCYRVRSVDTEGDVSDWCRGKVMPVLKSNIYVMHNGVLTSASQVYLGGVGPVAALASVGGQSS